MGNDTASNQKRTIATKGTKHIARTTGPTDVCKNPKGDTAPFDNFVPTTRLLKGQTQVTKIAGSPIWNQAGEVGPPSDPAHDPFPIGVKSGVYYRKEATPTSWSQDLFTENKPVIRTNDTTDQNRKNTTGFVDGSKLGEGEGLTEELAKKKCCFTNKAAHGVEGLTGKQDDRELGWVGKDKTGEADFLEILAGKEVKLKSTRIDLTKPGMALNPKCELVPEHTTWRAKRTGGGAEDKEKTGSGIEFLLDKGLTQPSKSWYVNRGSDGADKKVGEEETKLSARKTETSAAKVGIEGTSSSVRAAVQMWKFKKNPCTIQVEAFACGGSRKVLIRVYPDQSIEVAVSLGGEIETENKLSRQPAKDWVAQIVDSMRMAQKVGELVNRLLSCAKIKTKITLFAGFKITFKLGFKECKEEKVTRFGDYRSKAHVGLAWKLSMSSMPLLAFEFSYALSLLTFAAPYFPAIVGWLRDFNIRADLVFTGSLSIELSIDVGSDELDVPYGGGSLTLGPTLTIALVFETGMKILTLSASFPGKIQFSFLTGDEPNVLIRLAVSGEIKTVLTAKLFEGKWYQVAGNYEPPALKTDFDKGPYRFPRMPAA
jgi:hypothetical protein